MPVQLNKGGGFQKVLKYHYELGMLGYPFSPLMVAGFFGTIISGIAKFLENLFSHCR